jgi:hypothetical protein
MWGRLINTQIFRAAQLSADSHVGREVCVFIDIDIVTERVDNIEIETCFFQNL